MSAVRTLILLGCLPGSLAAQSLEQRIAGVGTGTVHLSFAARAGVCGDGFHNTQVDQADEDWQADCDRQPARVALTVRNGHVMAVKSYVGGHWRAGSSASELGTIAARDAAGYLISLAERGGSIAGDPLLAATLADSVVIWPSLLRLARSRSLPSETRRSAVFWLAQAAGSAIAPALDSIAGDSRGDHEVRKQAVFALSQRSGNEGVPALIRIARTSPDPGLRKTVLFWLGQSDDPRALALFEEILR
ncbi:MAG: HEAT repeat domain-containing protein [Gemmatimonadales bacterium]